ncbi:MAG TPA: TIM-barrel domain-containing protein [Solimonas sp.]|nr:TIM-barrel domain-containing protein [Solimonas sp.]
MRHPALLLAFGTLALLAACGQSSPASQQAESNPALVRDGHARFMVLSPTLIRLEYAQDDRFEDGPTQTVLSHALPVPPFSTHVDGGERVIQTAKLTLRYRQDSGPFTPENLSVILAGGARVQPDWTPGDTPGNLGGWRRGLDNEQDSLPLHDGLLSRDGWYLIDDSATVVLTATPPGFAARPARSGAYQDGYFFGYGLDYVQALADLRALTGPAPLLPRKAFGVWFSRYWAYSDAEVRELVAQFRAHAVPLDTFSLDTDWKRMHSAEGCVFFDAVAGARPGDPCSWNGWSFNTDAFPDPAGFLAWAHAEGINIGANIHPSIDSNDPQFAATQAAAQGGLQTDTATPPCLLLQADPTGQCYVFDWTRPEQLQAYFALHAPLAALGIDFWWLDWCCDGASANAPGLSADTWINAHYAAEHESRGQRWPAFSRIGASFQDKTGAGNRGAGAFAEHRYTLHFTGDTCGTWQMLAFEAEFTAAEGAIGVPYVSHDIGSFLGPPLAGSVCNGTLGHTAHLPDDMYVRWLQFGTFQPLDRLHSSHGERLPWDYPGPAEQPATDFLRLRGRLVPYLYTLAREAHDSGLPMVRALYLRWPALDEAYLHRTQYLLGDDMLVAPVASAGNPATVTVWIPPGTWIDYFTGESFSGPVSVTRSVPYERYPVFMRAGAILPSQPDLPTSSAGPQDRLMLSVWAGADGAFALYEDEGQGFGYRQGAFAWTDLRSGAPRPGCATLTIGPVRGAFPGLLAQRSWTVRFLGVDAPQRVAVDGAVLAAPGWSYDAAGRVLSLDTGSRATGAPVAIAVGDAACV